MAVQMARNRPVGGADDNAVTVRPSSTALLSVDSLDRVSGGGSGTSGNFLINKNQSIFNGFFTRIAMTEITLDWCIPNVSDYLQNNTFTVTVGPTTITIDVPDGTYTVAECIDTILSLLNAPIPAGFGPGTFRIEDRTGAAWSPGTSIGLAYLATTGGGNFTITPTDLSESLGINGTVANSQFPFICPKLLPYYYLDFVSPQLTYNQELKDNTTNAFVRDVLYRWVFAYDNSSVVPLDKYGYPILQGYKSFVARRYLSYPKQILWNPSQPVGQLSFQIYTSNGDLLNPTALGGECEYQLSLLFSEN
jgi:hypothetical protein